MDEIEPTVSKPPSIFRNYISFIGAAIVLASLVSVVLLFLIEITSKGENPYLGILTYIIFPSVLMFGLLVIGIGGALERRRRRRASPEDLSLIHISEPTRLLSISYAVFCLKKKKK